MKTFRIQSAKMFLYAGICLSTLISGCKKDNEPVGPAVDFTGRYLIVEDDPDDSYTLRVERHPTKAGTLNLHNFGDFMNVPVEGRSQGDRLVIPTQTFSQRGKDLILSGSATFRSDTLYLEYQVRGFTEFDASEKAVRQK
jgi:hypothetical protein